MKNVVIIALLSLVQTMAYSQISPELTPAQYIDLHGPVAVAEMHRSGIPASINLAQGILETGFGNSDLVRKGLNHFGIKASRGWTGEVMTYKGMKWRKYPTIMDSYKDHSDFLKSYSRYDFLFEYEITDYENWARGLGAANYCPEPDYPDKLIDIIERYDLYKFDTDEPNVLNE